MKPLALLVILAMSLAAFGQDITTPDKPVKAKIHRYWIGANFSPDVDYRVLIPAGTSMSKSVADQFNRIETVKFGYTTGVDFCIDITKVVGIQVGLQYSNKGWATIDLPLSFGSSFNGSGFNTVGYSKEYDTYNYFDIPVKVNFTAGKKKVRFIGSVGVAPNILISATNSVSEHLYGPPPTVKQYNGNFTDMVTRGGMEITASAGFEYRINERMNLRVEPTFRFGAVEINPNTETFATDLYSGGVNLSYFFGL